MTRLAGADRAEDTTVSLVPLLVELRSAVGAGASCAAAVQEAFRRDPDALPGLAPVAHSLALGMSLDAAARLVEDEDGTVGLLVRALAVAERAGTGAGDALAQAQGAVEQERELARLLRVRTAQARGSLRVLALAPPGVVGFFVLLQPEALGFYATTAGRVTAGAALGLLLLARRWARAIVTRVPAAAAAADPLGARHGGGAAELAELLAIALRGGLAPVEGVRLLMELGPPAARPALRDAERALAAGIPVEAAFARTPLHALGPLLGTPLRWGARVDEALRAYADGLRAERRAALAEAAERAELRLVFPTTLLTLPSFLLAVVPPLLWTAFAS